MLPPTHSTASRGRVLEETTVLFSARSVAKVYQMGEVAVHALRDVTLDIYDGEILIVQGPSGSGKSTLLNIIGGMDAPSNGTATFFDRNTKSTRAIELAQAGGRELTRYRREQIGFVFQFFNLIPSLTALENIEVATEIVPDPLAPMETLALVGLEDRAHHFPSQLSGGQQQRVAIARALAGRPRFLLCDEPTGALDTEASRQIMQILYDLNRQMNKTIVIITHNPSIAQMGHRVITLRDGAVESLRRNERPLAPDQVDW